VVRGRSGRVHVTGLRVPRVPHTSHAVAWARVEPRSVQAKVDESRSLWNHGLLLRIMWTSFGLGLWCYRTGYGDR
jgi:hypothetical protein